MADEVAGLAPRPCLSELGEGEEARPCGEVAVVHLGEEGDAVLEVGEAGAFGEGDGERGEIETAPRAPGVLGHGDEQPARTKDGVAGRVDLGHGEAVALVSGMAEVRPVGRVVACGARAEVPAALPVALVEVADVTGVGGRGDHEVDVAGELAEHGREPPRVALADVCKGA